MYTFWIELLWTKKRNIHERSEKEASSAPLAIATSTYHKFHVHVNYVNCPNFEDVELLST